MPVFCPVITPTTLPFNRCFNPQVTLGLTRNGLSLSHLSPGILCPAHYPGTQWSSTNICYRNKMESLSSVLPLPRPRTPSVEHRSPEGADWSCIKEDGDPQQSNGHYIPGPQNSGSQNQDLVLRDKSSRGRGKSALQHWMGPDISIKEQVFTDVTGQEVRSKSLDYP